MVGDEVRRNPNRASEGRRYALSSSSSCSCSSSSYLSLSPSSENCGECGFDGMELEAARALACISRTAAREGGGRGLERFKDRSRDGDWEIGNRGRDLAHDSENNKAIGASLEEKTKVEQISESLPRSSNCSTNSLSFSRRKTRLSLTETERESRRVRRVLANRESARQTIRRRQAFRDGLAKKVSDLSLVNQSMKIVKGQLTKEYMSLKNKNKQLKTELAMAIAYNTISAATTCPPLKPSSSTTENSFLISTNPSFTPCILPSWPSMASHSRPCYNRTTEPQTPCFWFCSSLDQIAVSRRLLPSNRKEKEFDLLPTLQEQNQRENLVTHTPSPSKVDVSHKLDIDLNSLSVTPEPSFDAPDHHSSIGDEPVRASGDRSDRFYCASATASARRRRKEILKLKHLCGAPIVLHV